jgi:ribosomal protein L7/L12
MFKNIFGKPEDDDKISEVVLSAIEQRVDMALLTLNQEPGARNGEAEDRILSKLDRLNAALAVAVGDPLADHDAVSDVPDIRMPPARVLGPASEFPEVEAAIRSGNLIYAIKIYRDRTGRGLKESKDAVDAMAERMRNR